MGCKAQRVGAELEKWLGAQNDDLRGRGLADVRRTKPQVNILRRKAGGRLECVMAGNECADFEGVLRGGRAVVFDAKTSQAKRLSFSMVPDKQLAYLAARAAFGARAFFYFRWRESDADGRDYVVPVSGSGRIGGTAHKRSQEILALSTRESINVATLERLGYAVEPGEMWLDALARIIKAGAWDVKVEEVDE